VGALYGVAYTLTFMRKRNAKDDFRIGALEACRWTDDGKAAFAETPRGQWRGRLRLAAPDGVDRREVEAAIAAATTRKGGRLEGSDEAAGYGRSGSPPAAGGGSCTSGPTLKRGRASRS
jgi:hypothetical protein